MLGGRKNILSKKKFMNRFFDPMATDICLSFLLTGFFVL